MKIVDHSTQIVHFIETDEPGPYNRYRGCPGAWEVAMGESWEPVYGDRETLLDAEFTASRLYGANQDG